MRIGEILCRAGLISEDQLDYALHLQQHTGERLGAVLITMGACSQEQIDQAFLAASLRGPVESAIDHACADQFTAIPGRSVRFVEARRRTVVIENLLDSGVETRTESTVEATVEVAVPGYDPVLVPLTLDARTGAVALAEADIECIRQVVTKAYLAASSASASARGLAA